jgi:hypothetical protein
MVIESKIYKYHVKPKHFEFDNLARFNNFELLRSRNLDLTILLDPST